ncbi:MAG: hypothetical protein O3B13_03380 [Planctomycetota bacterium]|nr:hypothetical protein [Planctomycetota bacterium]
MALPTDSWKFAASRASAISGSATVDDAPGANNEQLTLSLGVVG